MYHVCGSKRSDSTNIKFISIFGNADAFNLYRKAIEGCSVSPATCSICFCKVAVRIRFVKKCGKCEYVLECQLETFTKSINSIFLKTRIDCIIGEGKNCNPCWWFRVFLESEESRYVCIMFSNLKGTYMAIIICT